MIEGCGGSGHRRLLRQHLFFPVAGEQHVELILIGTQFGAGLTELGAGVIQIFLRNGVGNAHGRHAVQVDLRVFRQSGRATHRRAGLGDFFHAVAALKAQQGGLLPFKFCGGLIALLGQQIIVNAGQSLTGGHGIAFVNKHTCNAPVNAKAQVNLPYVHIAIQHKLIAIVPQPLPQQKTSQQHSQSRAKAQNLTGDSHIPPCVQPPQAFAAPDSFMPGSCAPLPVRIASGGGLVHAARHV